MCKDNKCGGGASGAVYGLTDEKIKIIEADNK